MKIAIIGSGISGNSAAWILNSLHDVTLFETRARTGGHASTVDIDYDGTSIAVDTGFIVYNEPNYPDFVGLLDHLGVASIETNMSFSVSVHGGLFNTRREWNLSDIREIIASAPNFLRPSFIRLVAEIKRFAKQSIEDLEAGKLRGLTLNDYCKGYHSSLAKEFLIPMGAAIWSTPGGDFGAFPAENFVRFFANHKILDWDAPVWRTVEGGSRTYVNKIMESLVGRVRLAATVTKVRREAGQAILQIAGQEEPEIFDHVIFACHSDQALAILEDPADEERAILSAVPYKSNKVYLHRDPSLMPKKKSLWASWNYMDLTQNGRHGEDICVSYWMNKLQSIDRDKPIFITLNPPHAPAENLTFGEYSYSHPVFDARGMAAQRALEGMQGMMNTWFCGAWTGYGFHEDGLRSGLNVAEQLGAVIPWRDTKQTGDILVDAAE